jgi:hypothetical protein
MRDSFGNPAVTALMPLHMPFYFIMHSKKVFYHDGKFNSFVDDIGILDKDFTDHFVQRRERALRDFIAHFKDAFDDSVII